MTKVMPHSIELERALLSACLKDRDALEEVRALIPGEDVFYHKDHRRIWEVLLSQNDSWGSYDVHTVHSALPEDPDNPTGWSLLLRQILSSAATSAHAEHHTAELVKLWQKREYIAAMSRSVELLQDGGANFDEAVERVRDRIDEVSAEGGTAGLLHVRDVIPKVLDRLNADDQARAEESTGLSTIDKYFGLSRGSITCVAGESGSGKSALAGTIAANVCLRDQGVIYFTYEMPDTEMVARVICSTSGSGRLTFSRYHRGTLENEEKEYFTASAQQFNDVPLWINEDDCTIAEIERYVRRVRAKIGDKLRLVVVDFIQQVPLPKRVGFNTAETAAAIMHIVYRLKRLAKTAQCHIVAISALDGTADKEEKPRMSMLSQSKGQRFAYDYILFLWNFQRDGGGKGCHYVDGHILKARQGEIREQVPLQFKGPTLRFTDREKPKQQLPEGYEAVKSAEELPF